MTSPIPASIAYKRIEEAVALLQRAPKSQLAVAAISALCIARGRMKYLEQRLGETETMRDRIAMQLLPSLLADYGLPNASTCTAQAYQWADAVLAQRAVEGSAGAPGETTSPDFSTREYKVGDQFKLRGELVTIDEVMASPGHPPQYSWVFPKGRGSEGCYTAQEIADLQARYGDA